MIIIVPVKREPKIGWRGWNRGEPKTIFLGKYTKFCADRCQAAEASADRELYPQREWDDIISPLRPCKESHSLLWKHTLCLYICFLWRRTDITTRSHFPEFFLHIVGTYSFTPCQNLFSYTSVLHWWLSLWIQPSEYHYKRIYFIITLEKVL